MKRKFVGVGGLVGAFMLVASASADGGFQTHVNQCVERFADPNSAASVVLECTAADGKLGACKVVENSAPGKGFDKAAICLADYLPMGSRTGPVRVPLRFAGS